MEEKCQILGFRNNEERCDIMPEKTELKVLAENV